MHDSLQMMLLFENGFIISYSIDNNYKIDQMFTIEFPSIAQTSDMKLIKIINNYQALFAVGVSDYYGDSFLYVVLYDWESNLSKYY
jgi:hypothetical protein